MCFCIICVVYIACILLYVSCMHVTYTGLLRAGPEPGKNISGPPWTVLPPSCMVPGCCRCSCGHPPPPSLLSPSRNAFGLRPQGAHGMRGGGGEAAPRPPPFQGGEVLGVCACPLGWVQGRGIKVEGMSERASGAACLPACPPTHQSFRLGWYYKFASICQGAVSVVPCDNSTGTSQLAL